MSITQHALAYRRDGKLFIEIPESSLLMAVNTLLKENVVLKDKERLLDHLTMGLLTTQHTFAGEREPALDQLIREAIAGVAHAGAGLEWNSQVRHELVRQ